MSPITRATSHACPASCAGLAPIRRAIQRDEAAIERWRSEVWPELVAQAGRERRVPVFVDESGFYLLPGVVKTYAPEGRTPVLREKLTRDHLSVMGGMTPEGKLYTLVRQESLNGWHSIEFLVHLGRVAGKRLLASGMAPQSTAGPRSHSSSRTRAAQSGWRPCQVMPPTSTRGTKGAGATSSTWR